MKYIKKYESDINYKYKDGDYVKLLSHSEVIYSIVKIISSGFIENTVIKYKIEYIRLDLNMVIKNGNILESGIDRKCTKEEISNYETKKSQIKFNL